MTDPLDLPGVYYIRCVPTGDMYVGGTKVTIRARLGQHKSCLKHGKSFPEMQKLWDEYGRHQFDFCALKAFPADQVKDREKEAIRRLQPSLNKYLDPAKRAPKKQRTGAYVDRRKVEVRGEVMTHKEIALKYSLALSVVSRRIYAGDVGEQIIRPANSRNV